MTEKNEMATVPPPVTATTMRSLMNEFSGKMGQSDNDIKGSPDAWLYVYANWLQLDKSQGGCGLTGDELQNAKTDANSPYFLRFCAGIGGGTPQQRIALLVMMPARALLFHDGLIDNADGAITDKMFAGAIKLKLGYHKALATYALANGDKNAGQSVVINFPGPSLPVKADGAPPMGETAPVKGGGTGDENLTDEPKVTILS